MIDLKQILCILILLIVVLLIIRFAKSVLRLILLGVLLIGGLIYFNVVSPDEVMNVYKEFKVLQESQMQELAKLSENVRVDMQNGVNLQINIEGVWYSTSDIAEIKHNDGNYYVVVGGKEYIVKDLGVQKVLQALKK